MYITGHALRTITGASRPGPDAALGLAYLALGGNDAIMLCNLCCVLRFLRE